MSDRAASPGLEKPSWRWGSRHGQAGEKALYSCACPLYFRQLGPSLPRAGALPVGGRTGRVYTLEAASSVEAHLARPTLDAIFLTLVDVWAVGCGRRWEGRTWERKTRGGHVKKTSFLRWSPEERPSPTPLHLPGACLCRAWFIGTSSHMGEVQTEENSPGRVWIGPGCLTLAVLPAGKEAVARGAEAIVAPLCVLAGMLTQAPHTALIKVWSRWGQKAERC